MRTYDNPLSPSFRSLSFLRSSVWFGLSLLFTGWASCSGDEAHARSLHLDYYHARPPKRAYNKQEHAIVQHMRWWYYKQKVAIPVGAPGLREAAWLLAERLSRRPMRRLPHRLVKAALTLSGSSDHQIRIFGMAYRNLPQLKKAMSRTLARTLAGQRGTHFGLALRHGKHSICIFLTARRGAQLKAFSRWARQGKAVRLVGQLYPGFQAPKLMIGQTNGAVQTIKVVRKKHGLFYASWTPKTHGPHRIQLLVRDHQGPWISSQWDLQVLVHAQSWEKLGQKLRQVHKKMLWSREPHPARRAVPKPRQRFKSKWTGQQAAAMLHVMVNRLRERRKLSTLRRLDKLDKLALSHAKEMIEEGFFAHTSPQRGSFAKRFGRLHWTVKAANENIVVGRDPSEGMYLLEQSPAHRRNLLDPRFTHTGLGAAIHPKTGRIYFVQVFVKP